MYKNIKNSKEKGLSGVVPLTQDGRAPDQNCFSLRVAAKKHNNKKHFNKIKKSTHTRKV